MNQLLRANQILSTSTSQQCKVIQFLGSGGQGEVYEVELGGKRLALKWYYPNNVSKRQIESLQGLIEAGAPNGKFLWPLQLVTDLTNRGLGYLMALRPAHFKGISDVMKRRIEPSFKTLLTAAFFLADSYLQLHLNGWCYQDISFGNIFFDPMNGNALICDNDNVCINGKSTSQILGTPRFIAPELITSNASPNTETDLHSLAILLFYLLLIHHPLEGEKELEIKCFDLAAMNRLYGSEPVFIFDPDNDKNRPKPGYHDNALAFWYIYPLALRSLFIEAFTVGLRNPSARIRESQWRNCIIQTLDSLYNCNHCSAENFFDKTNRNLCWNCKKDLQISLQLIIEKQVICLNQNSQLFRHHIEPNSIPNLENPVGKITQHPHNPSLFGIQNLTQDSWKIVLPNKEIRMVDFQKNVPIVRDILIEFPNSKGIIK